MPKIKLTYSGVNSGSRVFDTYSINVEDVDFKRRMHSGLDGSLVETNIGYRRVVSISFKPLLDDKQALFFLYAWALASTKQVIYYTNASGHVFAPAFDSDSVAASGTGNTLTVVFQGKSLLFEHDQSFFVANQFTLELVESSWTNFVQPGVTKILKPIYTPTGHGISGNTFSCYVNLLDQSSVDFLKNVFVFADENVESLEFGYRHNLAIDTGLVYSQTERNWLRDFCLSDSKQVDTRSIDSLNGKLFDVVYAGDGLRWRMVQGLGEGKAVGLEFKEKSIRTVAETYVPPSAHEFILDTDVLDGTDVVVG